MLDPDHSYLKPKTPTKTRGKWSIIRASKLDALSFIKYLLKIHNYSIIIVMKKEIIYVNDPIVLSCPDKSHPLFTINITEEKPIAVCYYCSKTWILNNGKLK